MANYLIWSNQQRAWWRPNQRGYTSIIEEAGRYSLEKATEIVNDATADGQLKHSRINPITGKQYDSYDEVMVQEVTNE